MRLRLGDCADHGALRDRRLRAPHLGLRKEDLLPTVLVGHRVREIVDDGSRAFEVGIEANGDVDDGARPLLRSVPDPCDGAVRYVPDVALDITKAGDPKRKPFHLTGHVVAHVDHVADAELVFHDHEEPGKEVAHDALRAEAQGHTEHARARDHRRDVDAQLAHDHEHRDHEDEDGDDAAHHVSDGLDALGSARPGERADLWCSGDPLGEPPDQPARQPRRHDRDDDDEHDLQRFREIVGDLRGIAVARDLVDGRAEPRLVGRWPARGDLAALLLEDDRERYRGSKHESGRDDVADALRHHARRPTRRHRDAVEHVTGFHRALLVRDDHELRVGAELVHEIQEPVQVYVVQRGLDLVEQIEG